MAKSHSSSRSLMPYVIMLLLLALALASYVGINVVMHAGYIRSIASELHHYNQATTLFRQKYDAWPGDFAQAHATWPSQSASSGNADGFIFGGRTEEVYAWHHLELGQFLKKSYTGKPSTPVHEPGVNVPASEHVEGGYGLRFDTVHGNAANFIMLAGPTVSSLGGDILSPYDAYTLDHKMDDGIASTGDILGNHVIGSTGCTIAGEYISTSEAPYCHIYSRLRN